MNPFVALLAFAVIGTSAPQTAPRAVQVGGMPDLDACLSVGQVVRLNPKGDNFLSVRAAPSAQAAQIDKLRPKAEMFVCDEAAGGEWLGVVYEPGGTISPRCDVGSPIPRKQKYRGPCASGWVSAKFIEIIAG
ncbi:MAG: integron [Sphingomonadales bacterium]|nr:MAG: integron [Sphingomonadales bacterium]